MKLDMPGWRRKVGLLAVAFLGVVVAAVPSSPAFAAGANNSLQAIFTFPPNVFVFMT